MSAQILQFPRKHLRVCRWVNGSIEYRMVAGTDVPKGWTLVMRRVVPDSHKGIGA
jgi:hypothetical protein